MQQTHYDRLMKAYSNIPPSVYKTIERLGPVEGVSQVIQEALSSASRDEAGEVVGMTLSVAVIAGAKRVFSRNPDPFQVQPLIDDSEFDALCQIIHEMGLPYKDLTTVVSQSKHVAWFELGGKRIYEVSPGLADQLRHTELRGLKTDDLQLPFPSIFISVPPQAALHALDPNTGKHQVDGVYIVEDKGHNLGRVWHVLVTGLSKDPSNPLDDATHFFRVELPADATLEEALERTRATMEKEWVQFADGTDGRLWAEAVKWVDIFRWAMNVVVYATWGDAVRDEMWMSKEAKLLHERAQKAPKGSEKRKRLHEELRDANTQKYTYLGRGVVYEPEEGGVDGRKLNVRVRVQGHWRNQAHGEGRALRKTIWIQPFWRGPEGGEIGPEVHRLT